MRWVLSGMLRRLASRRSAIGVSAVIAIAVCGMAVFAGWDVSRYHLPEPGAMVPPTVKLYAGGAPLASVQGDGRIAQVWVPLDRMPRVLVDAVLVAEDRRFYAHPGVDLAGIVRAASANLRRSEVVQGASTVTQQLARSLFLDKERSWRRKLREVRIALALERRYDKARILEAYLNTVYLGHDADVAVLGVAAAARRFLGKDVTAVRPDEAAFLAAAIRAPNRILGDGGRHARAPRDGVLQAMAEQGALSAAEAQAARERPVPARPPSAPPRHGYFVDVARDEVARRVALPRVAEVRIDTALDPRLQAVAEAAVTEGLDRLERRHKLAPGTLQAAVVALEPASGRIRVMVGGRRYADSRFNRATRAHRQPGSLFKPFVYLAAFETPPAGAPLTPASMIEDEPVVIRAAEGGWSPRNIDGQFQGPVTVRRALEQSLNVPAARIGQAVGIRAVSGVARALGVDSRLAEVPSLALGSSEVTLLEITTAFATIANGGVRVTPTTLDPEAGPGPAPAMEPNPAPWRAVSPVSAFQLTHLLRGVMRSGTGAGSARYGLQELTAGKTGTTNDLRDAWFVGYTPQLVVGVWVGNDEGRSIGMTGSDAALPIWGTIMQSAVRRAPPRPFTAPPGVVMAEVDRVTGRRASTWCASGPGPMVVEAFREGTEPRAECSVPSVVTTGTDRVIGWFRELFR